MILRGATRLMHLLAAALVAAWPAGSTSACCCTSRPEVHADDCHSGCCAAKVAAACSADPADSCVHCCPSASQRDSCGCWQNCGEYRVQRNLSIIRPDSRPIIGDTIPGAGWPDLRPATFIGGDWIAAAAPNSTRPVRVLYGVWRN